MRKVTIELEYDPEVEKTRDHELACIYATNGAYYHRCLRNVFEVLINYDADKRKKSLSKDAQEVLDDIRKKCAKEFRGVYHEGTD